MTNLTFDQARRVLESWPIGHQYDGDNLTLIKEHKNTFYCATRDEEMRLIEHQVSLDSAVSRYAADYEVPTRAILKDAHPYPEATNNVERLARMVDCLGEWNEGATFSLGIFCHYDTDDAPIQVQVTQGLGTEDEATLVSEYGTDVETTCMYAVVALDKAVSAPRDVSRSPSLWSSYRVV
jgi:hypothetical protein